jgi:hypothetical protein
MIFDCENCYNRIVITPDDREARIRFCPCCGEPQNDTKDDLELDFRYYDDEE